MPFVKNNSKHIAYKEYEPPAKKIVSEGDILIKNLAEKQQNSTINLQEYLQKESNFQKLAEHISVTSCCSGVLSVEQFKIALEQLEEIEDLRACNLSNDDVKLILDHRDGRIQKYKNMEPHILRTRIEKILESIKTFKENSQNKSVNKNEISHKNEAFVLKPDSTETKLLKFAMQNKSTNDEKLPHPMDNLKLIEEKLISRLSEKELTPSKIQKGIRRRANKISFMDSLDTNHITNDVKLKDRRTHSNSFVNESKWDVQVRNNITSKDSVKVYTCKPQHVYTIKNGRIIELSQNKVPKKVNIQMENRLSMEEIKAIPKFKNFDIGLPSRVLYLKNLPKHVNESDLNELFSKFTTNNSLSFRIMSGKMRGLAFVTFPDVNTAVEALHSTNGVLLDGKPVVIEFGRDKPNTKETITFYL